jgi:DNA mismatch repair protein MutL
VTDIIQLLPDSVANQIAAGEVIQRPASVVKELVENAIDAGADRVQVQIKDAGRTLIQVSDNGKGMSPTDARMAFERHATSKIRDANDLFRIKTMGFRGEALASIASVADVLLKTRQPNDEVGTSIHISGSEVLTQEPTSCNSGTTFLVRNLFFNVPARRKFLKSNTVEFKHIINEFQRTAMDHPAIAFSLHHNDALVYDLPASNMRKRIVHLFGNAMNQTLLPIHSETSIVAINGFIGQPKAARKSFGEQFVFVNNRVMKHPYFHRAVVQAYEKLISSDAIPSYFIFFDVDPEHIAINIHPTKTEIKFESENAIWQLLLAAVREGLGKFNAVPSIDFDQSGSIDIPLPPKSSHGLYRPEIQTNPDYNPFKTETQGFRASAPLKHNDQTEHWEKLYQLPSESDNEQGILVSVDTATNLQTRITPLDHEESAVNCRNILILKGKYILIPVKSGLMVIDQRRAHQRILYEQFLKTMDSHMGLCQQ